MRANPGMTITTPSAAPTTAITHTTRRDPGSRKAVAANQVFHPEEDSSADQSGLSLGTTAQDSSQVALTETILDVQPRSAFSFDSPRPTAVLQYLGARRRNLAAWTSTWT